MTQDRTVDGRTESDGLSLLVERVRSTLDGLDGGFPYVADPETGNWTVTDDGNWCGGHWIGMLWLANDLTGEERFERAARQYTETLTSSMPDENMFYGMNHHYAGFRAYDSTGEAAHRDIGIHGAERTLDYFHEGARQVPLGTLGIEAPASNFRGPDDDGGPSGARLGAVDALYTAIPVLWRAYRETNRTTFRDVAVSHADRFLDWYIRPDGSTWHHVEFDPETGDLRRQYNELAYSDQTCWARGQGWAIAGLASAFRETEAPRYLNALENVVTYYVDHSPSDLVPYWDFEHPDRPNIERDTSAAALAAYGLTRLPETSQTRHLVETGTAILDLLLTRYLSPLSEDDERPNGMVLESCYNGPAGYATKHEHVWTDYYTMFTLATRTTNATDSPD